MDPDFTTHNHLSADATPQYAKYFNTSGSPGKQAR
jgi:hypothetical protein